MRKKIMKVLAMVFTILLGMILLSFQPASAHVRDIQWCEDTNIWNWKVKQCHIDLHIQRDVILQNYIQRRYERYYDILHHHDLHDHRHHHKNR